MKLYKLYLHDSEALERYWHGTSLLCVNSVTVLANNEDEARELAHNKLTELHQPIAAPLSEWECKELTPGPFDVGVVDINYDTDF